MGVERLKVKDIKNILMAFGEAYYHEEVMSLPGAEGGGEASAAFNVRGGATDQNPDPSTTARSITRTHLFGFFSVFNPDVKDMELYKSSIPPSMADVSPPCLLDINSREGNKKGVHGSASIGLLTSRLTLRGLFSGEDPFIVGGRYPLTAGTGLERNS